ncbi:MAG: DUF374 domain-containing protein [bacterium]|nr:DUF374 domain-containing protein [bacterium]
MHISGEKQVNILIKLINAVFSVQKHLTKIVEVGNPQLKPCIYAVWHGNQCSLFGLKDKSRLSILISKSVDGEIIASAVETLGFKTVRGSKGKKGSVEATMKMIELLKSGEDVAITVDGPRGPAKSVKDGVIKIAKIAKVPIVPMTWYSPDINFIRFPSWDSFSYPFGLVRLVNLYGEPIYVDENNTEEDDKKVKEQIRQSLDDLDMKASQAWKHAWSLKEWWKRQNEKNN